MNSMEEYVRRIRSKEADVRQELGRALRTGRRGSTSEIGYGARSEPRVRRAVRVVFVQDTNLKRASNQASLMVEIQGADWLDCLFSEQLQGWCFLYA